MENEFLRYSTVTGKRYNVFSTVKILNIFQAIFYMEHEIYPVDIKISEDRKTGRKCFVFYYIKEETKNVFDIWCKNKIDKKEINVL